MAAQYELPLRSLDDVCHPLPWRPQWPDCMLSTTSLSEVLRPVPQLQVGDDVEHETQFYHVAHAEYHFETLETWQRATRYDWLLWPKHRKLCQPDHF